MFCICDICLLTNRERIECLVFDDMSVLVYEALGFEFLGFLPHGLVMVSRVYMWDDDRILWNDFSINLYILYARPRKTQSPCMIF